MYTTHDLPIWINFTTDNDKCLYGHNTIMLQSDKNYINCCSKIKIYYSMLCVGFTKLKHINYNDNSIPNIYYM